MNAMYRWIPAVLLTAGAAAAQIPLEEIPQERIREALGRLTERVTQMFPQAVLKVVPDGDRAGAVKAERVVIGWVPDRRLSLASLDAAGETAAPAGWLILQGVAPVVDGRVLPAEQLPSLGAGDGDRPVAVLFIGVRKQGDRRLLDMYGVGEKPLLSAPLDRLGAVDAGAKPVAIGLGNLDQNARQVDLTLTLLGAHRVTLRLGAAN